MKKYRILLALSRKWFFYAIMLCGLLLPVMLKAQLPSAQQIASQMKIGWNLKNTLEATWVPRSSFGTTTQTAIDSVKAAGFNTVRLPVA